MTTNAQAAAYYYARKRTRLLRLAADAVQPASAFNPADISGVTLSNTNKTLTANSNTNGGARGLVSHKTGKRYLEYRVAGPSNNNVFVGLGTAAAGFEGSQDYGLCIVVDPNGTIHGAHFGTQAVGSSMTDGEVVSVCVDLDNSLAWFTLGGNFSLWNDDGTANPASGTGGLSTSGFGGGSPDVFPFLMSQGGTSAPPLAGATLVTGGFTFAAPVGFAPWG